MKRINRKMIYIIVIFSLIKEIEVKLIESGSFNDLQYKINNLHESLLNLENDYIFQPDEDKNEGIYINKTLIIDGKNHEINGLNESKIFLIKDTEVILKNINFIYGFSTDFGAVINLINASLEIFNCSFSFNIANINGGAIHITNSRLNLTESLFKFNQVKGIYSNGGGISAENSNIYIEKSIFLNNSADEGGAIYSINSTLVIFNSSFYNNNANWYGGALVSDSRLSIYDSNFNNNLAGYKGGSIHSTNSILSDDNFLIIKNTLMFNNIAEYGGAISSSNMQFVHIINSKIFNNYASHGAVISRMSSNEIRIINSSCYHNAAINGAILYSMSGGNNTFENDKFENNIADFGGLIYTLSGRKSSKVTDYYSIFINCSLLDNFGKKGLVYSIFDELRIYNSTITYQNKCYQFPIIYKIMIGRVMESNNWWGEKNPDLDKLIIYEYENYTHNKLNDTKYSEEGCSSTIIQIDEQNSAFTFRRDSDEGVNVNIIYQKNGILQYKNDLDYFWHAIINQDGWIVGNGGADNPHSCEKMEAFAQIMIKKNTLIDELIERISDIKSLYNLGHFLIKSPNGTYGLIAHIIGEKIIIEKGKLKPGEYMISPNNYKYYKKGNISDFDIKENYTYISRYLAAIDTYSSLRTNDFTYNYVTKDNSKYVDIFIANDDGSLSKTGNNSYLFNDIYINKKYIYGEKVPIIMNGMYLDRYIISEGNKSDNKNTNIKINIILLVFIIGLLIIN